MNPPSPNDSPPPRNGVTRSVTQWAALGLCAISLYLCYRMVCVMERAVTVMERVDAKIDRGVATSKAAIDRSKDLLNPELEESLKAAAKNKAALLGGKAKAWLEKSSENAETEQ